MPARCAGFSRRNRTSGRLWACSPPWFTPPAAGRSRTWAAGPGTSLPTLRELGDVARRDHPGLRFEVGSMTDLSLPDASVAGLLAFWSLIHVPDDGVPAVFGHFRRALRDGGPLLLGFHAGDGSRMKTLGYGGHPMKVCIHYRQPVQVAAWLRDAGFTVEAQMLLDPGESMPGALLFARRRP